MAPPGGKKNTAPSASPCAAQRPAPPLEAEAPSKRPPCAHAHLAPVTCSLGRPNSSGTEMLRARRQWLEHCALPASHAHGSPGLCAPPPPRTPRPPLVPGCSASWPRPPRAQVQTRLRALPLWGRVPAAFRPSSFLARASRTVSLLKRAT